VASAAGFGLLEAAASIAPDLPSFLVLLAAMGFANLVFQAMANAYVQLAVDPELRGRVMGLYMMVFAGGTPIGAPIIGVLTSHLGARAGMAICGVVPVIAALLVASLRVNHLAERRLVPHKGQSPVRGAGCGVRGAGCGVQTWSFLFHS
jgi:MFS family permease